jgi:hypothetical protein
VTQVVVFLFSAADVRYNNDRIVELLNFNDSAKVAPYSTAEKPKHL